MNKLNLIVSFIGSLFPIIFPDKEFQPKRLAAVVILLLLMGTGVHFLGYENVENILDLTEHAIELTEE